MALNDIDAEQDILSALISGDCRTSDLCSGTMLLPVHFWVPFHGHVYMACLNLEERGEPSSLESLSAQLTSLGCIGDFRSELETIKLCTPFRLLPALRASAARLIELHQARNLEIILRGTLAELETESIDVATALCRLKDLGESFT